MTAMAKDMARMFDPVLLARDCGIEPDPWQAELLRNLSTLHRILLLCSRQSGKSLVTALMALWVLLYEEGALVVIVSPSQRQSAEMLRSLKLLYGQLKDVPPLKQESALRLEFENGSRVISMPGSEKTVRGLSKVSLAIVDEAARVDDELFAAVRPMLATSAHGGRLVMLTTPFGKRGEFHRAWTEGGDVWTRVEVPASACPRISAEFLAD